MTREDATIAVEAITHYEYVLRDGEEEPDRFRGVYLSEALELLGREAYDRMMSDPIRRHGIRGTVYPWNVVDYLMEARKPWD